MFVRYAAVALLVTVAGAACIHANEQPERVVSRPAESGHVTVVDRPGRVTAPYVAGDRVYGVAGNAGPVKLASAINTTFYATLSPAAVPDRTGRRLVYSAFHRKRPVVRLHDVDTNEDSIVDEGAFSVAWRSDGALAYFKGLEPAVRNPRRYLGHVVVRASPSARPRRWTPAPARYVVAAWATAARSRA